MRRKHPGGGRSGFEATLIEVQESAEGVVLVMTTRAEVGVELHLDPSEARTVLAALQGRGGPGDTPVRHFTHPPRKR